MDTSRVTVQFIALTDMGAESRGNVAFGALIGERPISFEVPVGEEPTANIFFAVGVMEGLRSAGLESALLLTPHARLVYDRDGEITMREDTDEGREASVEAFATWPEAFVAANARQGVSSRE